MIANRPITCAEVRTRFPEFFTDSIGDVNRAFSSVGTPESAPASAAIFITTPKALAYGLESPATVWVVNSKFRPQAEARLGGNRTLLISENPELAMAKVINEYFLCTPYTNAAIDGVHPTSYVHPSAQLASGVRVGPGAFIGARVRIDHGVFIGANSVIEDQTTIGEGTVIHPLVYVGHSTEIGKFCEIHPQSVIAKEGFGYGHDKSFNHTRIPHQGRVVLEDRVHLGSGVTIDRATFLETRIKAGAIFDNQIHIAHNCSVGRNSVITSGFAMAGSSKIGANFLTGGKSVVTGHIEVCDNVQLAALSGVAKDVTEPGQYGGVPLVPLQQHIKIKAAIAKLPEMRRQLAGVLKKLGLSDDSTD